MGKQGAEFVVQSLMDYGTYFNESRSIPSIISGLKPSQTKILYGAHLLGLKDSGKYKKVINLVGAVVPFYMHGSSSLEGAITRMGQPFKMTYPVLDIQGNIGGQSLLQSPNAGAAASRYIETRLTKLGADLLKSISEGTAKMVPTYDGSMKEPEHLFIPIPAFLLFSQKGIGVGTATSIPSFEINSVIETAAELIKDPDLSYDDMAKILKPYYNQLATVINKSELAEIYSHRPRDGKKSSIKFRAKFEKAGDKLVISNFPYDASPSLVASQIQSKISTVSAFRYVRRIQDTTGLDKFGKEIVSMEIDLKRGYDIDELIYELCHHTSLESFFSTNLVLLNKNGEVQEYNIKEALLEWIEVYKEKARTKLENELEKLKALIDKYEGLIKALDEIDEIIELIKSSESKSAARDKLVNRGYTLIQADAILDMRLSKLANMEYLDLLAKRDAAKAEEEKKLLILHNEADFKTYLINVMSEYKLETVVACPQEDSLRAKVEKTKDSKVYLVEKGKNLQVFDTVPKTKKYIVADLKNPAYVLAESDVIPVKNATQPVLSNVFCILQGEDDVFHVNKEGRVKRTKITELMTSRKAAATKQSDVVFAGQIGDGYITLISNKGRQLAFHVDEVPVSGKGALGVKGCKMDKGEYISSVKVTEKEPPGVRMGRNKTLK